MPLDITAFRNYLTVAQQDNRLSDVVVAGVKTGDASGTVSLCSRTIETVDSTLTNGELRQSLLNALSPTAAGDQQILDEIRELLLEDRKVSQIAAPS